MKKFALDFVLRGLIACGFGPMILAITYISLYWSNVVETLPIPEICGGMTAIYQVEKLHIFAAIMLHGGVLYVAYLVTYLLNNWLADGVIPLLVFSGIFVVGFAVIWAIIYLINCKRIAKINAILKLKREK